MKFDKLFYAILPILVFTSCQRTNIEYLITYGNGKTEIVVTPELRLRSGCVYYSGSSDNAFRCGVISIKEN